MFDNPAILKHSHQGLTLLLDKINHHTDNGCYSYIFKLYRPRSYASIGRITYRQHLPEAWADRGDIGYFIKKKHRRKGYATLACQGLLTLLAQSGIDSALITCDKHHYGTPHICHALGGARVKETACKWYYQVDTKPYAK